MLSAANNKQKRASARSLPPRMPTTAWDDGNKTPNMRPKPRPNLERPSATVVPVADAPSSAGDSAKVMCIVCSTDFEAESNKKWGSKKQRATCESCRHKALTWRWSAMWPKKPSNSKETTDAPKKQPVAQNTGLRSPVAEPLFSSILPRDQEAASEKLSAAGASHGSSSSSSSSSSSERPLDAAPPPGNAEAEGAAQEDAPRRRCSMWPSWPTSMAFKVSRK